MSPSSHAEDARSPLPAFPQAAAPENGKPAAEDPLRRALRLALLRAPLLLPLCGTCGAIWSGQGWCLSIAAAALAFTLRLYRIAAATLLCALVAALQHSLFEQQRAESVAQWESSGVAHISGVVESTLSRSLILRIDHTRLRVAIRGDDMPYRTGDRLTVLGEYQEVRPPAVPGMFDTASWMRGKGIVASLALIHAAKTGYDHGWYGLLGYAETLRELLADRLMPYGTEADPRRQVLCALVLGARDRAEPDTMLDFRRGGCLHAFAVSGLHVGLVALLLWPLFYALRVRPQVSLWLVLLLVGIYVLMTGAAPPAVRAYMMLALALLSIKLRRQLSLLNVWSSAALAILLLSPHQLHNAGFLLSFLVYAGICLATRHALRDTPWFGPDSFIPYTIMTPWEMRVQSWEFALRGVVMIAFSAWLVSLPITACYFHTFNSYSFLTNIAITPILPVVMASGFAVILLGNVPYLGALAQTLAEQSSGALIAITSFFGSWPGAYLPITEPAKPHESMVMNLGFGKSSTILGNPGLLIDAGSESSARWMVEPALFHSGFTPAALLSTRNLASATGGIPLLQQSWPSMRTLRQAGHADSSPVTHISTPSGHYTIYAAPRHLPTRPAVHQSPVILWRLTGEQGPRRLLYIGDAAADTLAAVPREDRRAEVIILGANNIIPIDWEAQLDFSDTQLIILLPAARAAGIKPETFAPIPCYEVAKDSVLRF